MTTATLEPEAISVSPAPMINNFPGSIVSSADAASSSASLNSIVDSSEIQIDPATHLPFLKNVHFNDFHISEGLKSRLHTAGFKTPTPVQAKAIPPALLGTDILATASTGTGKTLSFLIPMIEHMDRNPIPVTKGKRGPIRSLILLPTRELAMQVLEAYAKLVPNAKHDAVLVCGGLSENTQLDQLGRGPRLVVATPGRLEDFLRRRAVNINAVEMLVLDEVDRMLDMGFLPAIRRIVGALPRTRQTMCYSATLDANVREVVRDYVRNPVRIEIGQTSKPSDQVTLRAVTVMQDQKLGLLDQMLREEEGTFLVFSRTKHGADRIAKKLERAGHDVDVIHGDRSQSQRTAALKGFSTGKHRVLVATDVAARGIDVQDIAHVVNYDLPNGTDDFVHRIGRTGRAGATGIATTFVMPQERSDARKMERELKVKFEWSEADKNLEKEERNKPLDLNAVNNNLLALETRSWKSGDASAQTQARNIGSSPYKGNSGGGFRSRAGGGGFGGKRSGAGHSSSSRAGSGRSGPARRGQ
ncbi:MAG TPA: DEAD/DEAH box helicase [Acidobacteriaceae bacterium]|nr:DEAD/DEAH box helicase [Acidobacteriaceae bacterium]